MENKRTAIADIRFIAVIFAIAVAVCLSLGACSGGSSSSDDDPESTYEEDTDSTSSYDSNYEDSDEPEHAYSSNSYSSSNDDDDDYDYLYDEDSGISGVTSEEGEGIFVGEDFAMRKNEDGTGIATDGKGNWVADTDGDGEVDSISIDGGDSWY